MTIEEIVQRFITELESQGLKYEAYFKMSLATSMRRSEACSLQWSDSRAWCRGDWRKMTICSGRLGRSDGAWDIHIPAQKDSAGGKIAGQFKCAQSVAFPSQMRLFYKLWVNYKHC